MVALILENSKLVMLFLLVAATIGLSHLNRPSQTGRQE
jgi:hypothetical protein